MRKLFNNPLFSAAVGGAAIVYFVFAVMPMLFSDDVVENFVDPIDPFGRDTQAPSEIAVVGAVDRSSVAWLEKLDRDPFEPLGPAHATGAGHVPSVSAVFHGQHRAAAVVNSTLVHVGDHVAGFEVLAIDKAGVVVVRDGERYVLEPRA